MNPQPYPSNLTDAHWSVLESLLPKAKLLGRPCKNDLCRVLDSIFNRNRNGCTWRDLPHDFPKWRAVSNDFIRWRDDRTRTALNDALRAEVRRQAGRESTLSAGSIDSQTVKATEIGGPHGYDGGKRYNGRKRHIVMDTLGLILAVTSAAADDGTTAAQVLAKLTKQAFPRLKKLWADNKYPNNSLEGWISEHGWYVIEIGSRPEGTEGFQVIQWRWVAWSGPLPGWGVAGSTAGGTSA